jgi:hypothetical protein
MHHFANPAKNRNPATFWPEPDLGRISKNGRFSAGAGAEIRYSPKYVQNSSNAIFQSLKNRVWLKQFCKLKINVHIARKWNKMYMTNFDPSHLLRPPAQNCL